MRTLILFVLSTLACRADITCAARWQNAYTYCKPITQFHAKVSNSDQPDFRMGIFGTDTDLKTVGNGGFVQSASGFDIIFTSDRQGQTLIPFDRAVWSATTGLFEFWFKRSLSVSVDTPIYMFFGNSAVMSDQQNKAGTWGENYGGVYHMGDGTTLDLTDSSGNGNTGTNHGATACTGQVTGAACFVAGSSQYIDLGNNSSLEITGAITIEVWAKYTDSFPLGATTFPTIVANTTGLANGYSLAIHGDDGGGFSNNIYFAGFVASVEKDITSGVSAVQNTVYSIGVTYDTTAGGNNAHLYINGAARNSAFSTNAIGSSTQAVTLSNWPGAAGAGVTPYWNGFLDEIRISNVAQTTDWIMTGYNNTNDPGTFYSIGAKVQNGSGGGLRIYTFR